MTDIQEGLNIMSMQDTINEIYRMRQEADDRERQELEDKIKQCDLNLLASVKDKSEPDEEFQSFYLQRYELLRQYCRKYGQEAEEQLRDKLDEARKDYVKQYVSEGVLKSQNGQINELMDIKCHILDELYKFPAVELLDVLLGLLKTQNKDLKAKVEEITRENNNVKKKQAEQWLIMLLCVISTLTLSTTNTQKVDQKDDNIKPMKVYY